MTVLDLYDAVAVEFGEPDVCVIGAGAAGIILATQLIQRGLRVAVLEGGGRDLEQESQSLYRADVVGQPHEGVHEGRFRTYGGSTTKWGGEIVELEDEDFEPRDWLPGSGWPFRKEELKPYYARALSAEGMPVADPDAEIWRKAGAARPDLGESLEMRFSRFIPEPDFTDFTQLYKAALETSDRLTVYLHANAIQLVFGSDASRVVAVRCRTLHGHEMQVRARTFVLCLGGIETVRFLLQPDHRYPWHGHPLLGRHFQDHVVTTAGTVEVRDRRRFHMYFSNIWVGGLKYTPKFKLPASLREAENLLDATAEPLFADDAYLMRIKNVARASVGRRRFADVKAGDVAAMVGHLPALVRHAWEFKHHGRGYHAPHTPIALSVVCEQEPLGRSAIALTNERDALGLFRATLNWHVSDLELRTIARCAHLVERALAERAIATVTLDADLSSNPDRLRTQCRDWFHHMGAARMGPTQQDGVVDPQLRIHGIDNAYVCSSAVFPTSSSANPTHTLIALAIRLSDTLSQALASRPSP